MGASLVHGMRLEKRRMRYPDGSEADELFAKGGDREFPTYSSMARLVRFCQERGVSPEEWPIFYGTWEGDVSPEEIRRRCEALTSALDGLPAAECDGDLWLPRVRAWLARGEVFAVFE